MGVDVSPVLEVNLFKRKALKKSNYSFSTSVDYYNSQIKIKRRKRQSDNHQQRLHNYNLIDRLPSTKRKQNKFRDFIEDSQMKVEENTV